MAIKINPADKAFSDCVRERALWTCERCKTFYPQEKRMGLHCAHYMSRGNWSTRFHPSNAAALCYGCHSFLDRNPIEKQVWFEDYLGKEKADQIYVLSKRSAYGIKKHVKGIAKHYRAELERMQRFGLAGSETSITRIHFDGFDLERA